MNGTTLGALRLALGLSLQEAASMIGDVAPVIWQEWENDDRPTPPEVEAKVRELVKWKLQLITEASRRIEQMTVQHGNPEMLCMTYYASMDDWMTQDGAEPVLWRPHCMAMVALAEYYTFVKLVRFDPVAYQRWLNGRQDSAAMRVTWAGSRD